MVLFPPARPSPLRHCRRVISRFDVGSRSSRWLEPCRNRGRTDSDTYDCADRACRTLPGLQTRTPRRNGFLPVLHPQCDARRRIVQVRAPICLATRPCPTPENGGRTRLASGGCASLCYRPSRVRRTGRVAETWRNNLEKNFSEAVLTPCRQKCKLPPSTTCCVSKTAIYNI